MGVLKDIGTFFATADKLKDDGVPSASMAFLADPSGTIEGNVITNGRENPETIYQAGGVSKAITALTVARLVDLKRITFETKVVELLGQEAWEDIIDTKTGHFMQYVTVEQLLFQRSGLSQHGSDNKTQLRFLSVPGSQCSHSGGNYILLQLVLERLLDIDFPEIMRMVVLEPLGMWRSRFGDLPDDEVNYAKTYMTPHTSNGHNKIRSPGLAENGLWTTPSDLLKVMSAIQKSLHADNGFLSTSVARMMLSNSHAYGWAIDETFFAHRGEQIPGYTCYMIGAHGLRPTPILPLSTTSPGRMSLCIMTNSTLGFNTIRKIVAAVFCLRTCPLYETLPSYGRMDNLVPYPTAEGIYVRDIWPQFVGGWSRIPLTSPSAIPAPSTLFEGLAVGEYEIFGENDIPYIVFDGVEMVHRLRHGCMPWQYIGATRMHGNFVVDGLDMAVRLMWDEETGAQVVQLVAGGQVTLLRRA